MNLSASAHHCILKLARTVVDLMESEATQFARLMEKLHASQPSEEYDGEIEYERFLGRCKDSKL